MKKLLIMSLYKKPSEFYKKQLELLFGDYLNVEAYYIYNNEMKQEINADLILITSHIIIKDVKKIIESNIKTIIMKRTFLRKGYKKLKNIEPGSDIMFVSSFYELAVEAIAKIYELGIKNINFIPVYPGTDEYSNLKIAVTPGEVDKVPDHVDKIIDINNRVIDLSTVMDIIYELNIPYQQIQHIILDYKKKIVPAIGFNNFIEKSAELKKQLKVILSMTNDGIIGVNAKGKITECNKSAEQLFNVKKDDIIYKKINSVLPFLKLKKVIKSGKKQENELITVHGINIVTSNYPIISQGELVGAVSINKRFTKMESLNQKFRKKIVKSGHIAKYQFSDIVGNSKEINNIKDKAKKMTRNDCTILITGESGTGKELFAHAIHNTSLRKEGPFVAINCSTLTKNLLEAELFGYESGAFTGAKKEGKQGLFELSHNGTIFLDEIGDIPYTLQAKLLRVLMEQEIMRVGGTEKIKVNTRVIAATNKKLLKLVKEKMFRKDLYYRLNVFPLYIPPLRERKSDIPVLINNFSNDENNYPKIPEHIIDLLQDLNWHGNVRELKNCVLYLTNMSDGEITLSDLPNYIFDEVCMDNYKLENEENDLYQVIKNKNLNSEDIFILEQLYISNMNNSNIGRRKIYQRARKNGYNISEYQIRYKLKLLEQLGMVKIFKGRKGTQITEMGKKALKRDRENS